MSWNRSLCIAGLVAITLLAGCADRTGSASKLTDWGTKSVDGGVRLNVQTKWRDGNLLYRASLTPLDSVRAFFAHRVTAEGAPKPTPAELVPYALGVELVDADGFKVDSIAIRKPELVEDWGSKSFELRGSHPVSLSAYRSIAQWHPTIAMGWRDRVAEAASSLKE